MKDEWSDKFEEWKMRKKVKKELDKTSTKSISHPSDNLITKTQNFLSNESKANPKLTKFLIFLAFAIPAAILLYALYINFLPFGYENSYVLTIDENGSVSPISSEFYITNTQGRKLLSLPNGVQGQINFVIEPKVQIKNATLNISIEGSPDLSLATPISFNPDSYSWDYNFDFSQSIPSQLNGSARYDNNLNCTFFDARKEQTLSLPNSQDLFESGPFTVYVKWKPSDISKELGNYQQIVGHYNWELYQNEDSVRFQVGRMNNINGTFYSVSYPIKDDFFSIPHEALAIYSPDKVSNKGYIELWVDGQFGGRAFIANDTIYADYNDNNLLNFGWSPHAYQKNPYFDGCISTIRISNKTHSFTFLKDAIFQFSSHPISIPIFGLGNISSIKASIKQ